MSRLTLVLGNPDLLKGTRFVLTLDADTQLPKNKGRELVEVLAHPLNRPQIDTTKENFYVDILLSNQEYRLIFHRLSLRYLRKSFRNRMY